MHGSTPPAATRLPSLDEMDLGGKRVLLREDLNVPVEGGQVTNAVRLEAALPTIKRCLGAGAAVLLVSHLGRPKGRHDPALSLQPIANELASRLGQPVPLLDSWRSGASVAPGAVALLENIRFEPGEERNDPSLARDLAALCDIFVMDAFGTAHRAHASTSGVARFAPNACAGPLLEAELNALDRALAAPARPLVAIVGGAKVSSKLAVLESLAEKADSLIVGGGIANTFLLAAGRDIGKSLAEADLADTARRIMARANAPLPVDVMTATEVHAAAPARLRPCDEVGGGEMIVDLGPECVRRLQPTLAEAGTILWNGPLGIFEIDQFGEGTRRLAEAVAASSAFSIAGGGDTLAAVDKYVAAADISYLSTGGGAFLEYVEGKTLPAVAALQARPAKAA